MTYALAAALAAAGASLARDAGVTLVVDAEAGRAGAREGVAAFDAAALTGREVLLTAGRAARGVLLGVAVVDGLGAALADTARVVGFAAGVDAVLAGDGFVTTALAGRLVALLTAAPIGVAGFDDGVESGAGLAGGAGSI